MKLSEKADHTQITAYITERIEYCLLRHILANQFSSFTACFAKSSAYDYQSPELWIAYSRDKHFSLINAP